MTAMEVTELLGNLGDFLGAIAVFVTIVYLAIQVRHSKEATEANTEALEAQRKAMDEQRNVTIALAYQERTRMMIETSNRIADSRSLAALLNKDVDDLDDVDRERLIWFLTGRKFYFDNIHFQRERGFVDDEYYELVRRYIREGSETLGLVIGPRNTRSAFYKEVQDILATERDTPA